VIHVILFQASLSSVSRKSPNRPKRSTNPSLQNAGNRASSQQAKARIERYKAVDTHIN